MNKVIGIFVVAAILFTSCKQSGKDIKLSNQTDTVSYFLGVMYAKGAKSGDFKVDPQVVAKAFEHVLAGDSIKFTDQEIQNEITNVLYQNTG
jgi:hypothetical protein